MTYADGYRNGKADANMGVCNGYSWNGRGEYFDGYRKAIYEKQRAIYEIKAAQ